MKQSILMLFGLLVAATGFAQPPAGAAGGGMPSNEVIFQRNDANSDGEITQAEAQAAGTQLGQTFATFDLNSDGKVVAEELDQMRGRFGGAGRAGAAGAAGPGAGGRAGGPGPAQPDDDDEEDE
jgi:hypothetical protein